jgi:hypothetical protein
MNMGAVLLNGYDDAYNAYVLVSCARPTIAVAAHLLSKQRGHSGMQ